MVLRSTPVFRQISRWLRPFSRSVFTVVFRFGFKTFILLFSHFSKWEVVRSVAVWNNFEGQVYVTWVGDFQVATSGGFWVAVRDIPSVKFSKSYKDKNDEWVNTDFFRMQDLPLVLAAGLEALIYMRSLQQEQKTNSNQSDGLTFGIQAV
jgi:hypothetical protein